MTHRFVVPGFDDDHEPIKRGIGILAGLIEKEPDEYRSIAIFIPSLAQLSGTSLEQALGKDTAKSLKKSPVRLTSSSQLSVVTVKTIKNSSHHDAIMVVYADQKMMDQIDGFSWIKAVIAVPHMPDALKAWVTTWNPVIYGEQHTSQGEIIENKVVKEALTTLSRFINLGNRVLNPRDEDSTKDMLRILRRHDEYEPIENIRAWAISNGWHPKCADELCKHAGKIFNMKSKPKMSSSTWAPDIYEQWVKKANG